MMIVDQIPGRGRSRELGLQPESLCGCARSSIRFTAVAVKDKKVYRSPDKIIIAFVAGQGEIIQVGLDSPCIPVMVAQRGEEPIDRRAGSVRSNIRVNEIVVILPDVLIYGRGLAKRIIIVTDRDDKIGTPAFDKCGNILLAQAMIAVIADHSKTDRSGWNGRNGWTRGGSYGWRTRRGGCECCR
jgi:hypothetical protein